MLAFRIFIRPFISFPLLALGCAALSTSAWASGSGMPWEQPLQQVLESVQGPSPRSSR